jgi:hypothetical protein
MAGGANKEFIEQGPKFLRANVVLSPNPQGYLVGKAGNLGITAANVSLIGIYDFDLVKEPTKNYRGTNGKRVDTYKLRLLEQRALPGLAVGNVAQVPVTKNTHAIRAFYLPWDNGRGWTVQLDDRADYLFTPTLDGCSVVAESGVDPRVSHINFQNAAQTQVDPVAIDNEIASIYGIGAKPTLRTLEKDDYSDDAQKAAGTQFTVTVVGFRDKNHNTWDFYYQRQISRVVPNPNGTGSLVQAILQDRLVPIV